ncbi:putative phosphatidate phosphatase LPIN [Blattamonas nauphoetae]|uniref:Phosphatidate phosphatase LPIN n=1 Tax=Blattamonas nauphoetae TaxID=2049346 RepID=A0ABQ9XCU5_9EUKA|nr:putative phosphatidate phosphatase LPIN [Blattamonas nauphoetae]
MFITETGLGYFETYTDPHAVNDIQTQKADILFDQDLKRHFVPPKDRAADLKKKSLTARLFVVDSTSPIVVSDIDGTITRSDVGGQILPSWGIDYSHVGISVMMSRIAARGYNFVYLTARGVGASQRTKTMLQRVQEKHGPMKEMIKYSRKQNEVELKELKQQARLKRKEEKQRMREARRNAGYSANSEDDSSSSCGSSGTPTSFWSASEDDYEQLPTTLEIEWQTQKEAVKKMRKMHPYLPSGPVLFSPLSLFGSFRAEVVSKTPELMKMLVLYEVNDCFGPFETKKVVDSTPQGGRTRKRRIILPRPERVFSNQMMWSGIGNKSTDIQAYISCGVSFNRIVMMEKGGSVWISRKWFGSLYSLMGLSDEKSKWKRAARLRKKEEKQTLKDRKEEKKKEKTTAKTRKEEEEKRREDASKRQDEEDYQKRKEQKQLKKTEERDARLKRKLGEAEEDAMNERWKETFYLEIQETKYHRQRMKEEFRMKEEELDRKLQASLSSSSISKPDEDRLQRKLRKEARKKKKKERRERLEAEKAQVRAEAQEADKRLKEVHKMKKTEYSQKKRELKGERKVSELKKELDGLLASMAAKLSSERGLHDGRLAQRMILDVPREEEETQREAALQKAFSNVEAIIGKGKEVAADIEQRMVDWKEERRLEGERKWAEGERKWAERGCSESPSTMEPTIIRPVTSYPHRANSSNRPQSELRTPEGTSIASPQVGVSPFDSMSATTMFDGISSAVSQSPHLPVTTALNGPSYGQFFAQLPSRIPPLPKLRPHPPPIPPRQISIITSPTTSASIQSVSVPVNKTQSDSTFPLPSRPPPQPKPSGVFSPNRLLPPIAPSRPPPSPITVTLNGPSHVQYSVQNHGQPKAGHGLAMAQITRSTSNPPLPLHPAPSSIHNISSSPSARVTENGDMTQKDKKLKEKEEQKRLKMVDRQMKEEGKKIKEAEKIREEEKQREEKRIRKEKKNQEKETRQEEKRKTEEEKKKREAMQKLQRNEGKPNTENRQGDSRDNDDEWTESNEDNNLSTSLSNTTNSTTAQQSAIQHTSGLAALIANLRLQMKTTMSLSQSLMKSPQKPQRSPTSSPPLHSPKTPDDGVSFLLVDRPSMGFDGDDPSDLFSHLLVPQNGAGELNDDEQPDELDTEWEPMNPIMDNDEMQFPFIEKEFEKWRELRQTKLRYLQGIRHSVQSFFVTDAGHELLLPYSETAETELDRRRGRYELDNSKSFFRYETEHRMHDDWIDILYPYGNRGLSEFNQYCFWDRFQSVGLCWNGAWLLGGKKGRVQEEPESVVDPKRQKEVKPIPLSFDPSALQWPLYTQRNTGTWQLHRTDDWWNVSSPYFGPTITHFPSTVAPLPVTQRVFHEDRSESSQKYPFVTNSVRIDFLAHFTAPTPSLEPWIAHLDVHSRNDMWTEINRETFEEYHSSDNPFFQIPFKPFFSSLPTSQYLHHSLRLSLQHPAHVSPHPDKILSPFVPFSSFSLSFNSTR